MHRTLMILLTVTLSLFGDPHPPDRTDPCKVAIENPVVSPQKAEAVCREVGIVEALQRDYCRASWYYLFAGERGYKYVVRQLSRLCADKKQYAPIAHAFVLDGNLSQAKRHYKSWLEHYHAKEEIERLYGAVHSEFAGMKRLYPGKSRLIEQGERVFQSFWEEEIRRRKEAKALQRKIYSCLYVVPHSTYRKRAPGIIGDPSNAKAVCETFLGEGSSRRMAQKVVFASLLDQNLSHRVAVLADRFFRPSDLRDDIHLRKRAGELHIYAKAITKGCTLCKKLKTMWQNYAVGRMLKQSKSYLPCILAYRHNTKSVREVCSQKGAEALSQQRYAIAFWMYSFAQESDRFHQTLAYRKANYDLVRSVREHLTSLYGIPKEKIEKIEKSFDPVKEIAQTYQDSYCLYAIDQHFDAKRREAICYRETFGKEASDLDDLLFVYDTNLTQEAIEVLVAKAIRNKTFHQLQYDRDGLERELEDPDRSKLSKRMREHLLPVIRNFYARLASFDDALDYYRKYEQTYKPEASVKLLRKVLALEEESPYRSMARMATLYTAMGYAYESLEEHNRSIACYHDALSIYRHNTEIENRSAEVWEYLSDLYHAMGDERRAIASIDKALDAIERERYVERARLWRKRAEAWMARFKKERLEHQIEEAIADLYRVIDLGRANDMIYALEYEPYHALSRAYRLLKRDKEEFIYAVESMERFLKHYYINFEKLSVRERVHYFGKRLPQMERILVLGERLHRRYSPRIGATSYRTAYNSWIEMKNAYFTHSNLIARYGAVTQVSDYRERAQRLSPLRSATETMYGSLLKGGSFKTYKEKMADIRQLYRTTAPVLLMEAVDRFRLRHQEVDIEKLTRELKEDQLYLDFVALKDRYCLFVIDRNATVTLTQYDANVSREIDALTEKAEGYLAQINDTDEVNCTVPLQHLKETMEELTALLIPQPLAQRLQGKKALVISPDGALWRVPFGVLRDQAGHGSLMDRYTIGYTPSVAVFMNEKAKGKPGIVVAIPGVGE